MIKFSNADTPCVPGLTLKGADGRPLPALSTWRAMSHQSGQHVRASFSHYKKEHTYMSKPAPSVLGLCIQAHLMWQQAQSNRNH